MLAELAACNAAFGIVKKFVQNGRSIADCAKHVGIISDSKDKLTKKLHKKKTGFMGKINPQSANDLEEFLALESIREHEAELKQLMIYTGRAGLWDSWQMFQKEARVARRDAEKAAEQQHEDLMYKLTIGVGVCVVFGVLVGLIYGAIILKQNLH